MKESERTVPPLRRAENIFIEYNNGNHHITKELVISTYKQALKEAMEKAKQQGVSFNIGLNPVSRLGKLGINAYTLLDNLMKRKNC